jgi:hypothetical protein
MAAIASNPLEDDFDDILINVVGLTYPQLNLLNSEDVVLAPDLIGVDEASLLAVFPAAGADKLTLMLKMRIRALREWVIYRTQELTGSNQDIMSLDFTDEVCNKFQVEIALRDKPGGKSSSEKSMNSLVAP